MRDNRLVPSPSHSTRRRILPDCCKAHQAYASNGGPPPPHPRGAIAAILCQGLTACPTRCSKCGTIPPQGSPVFSFPDLHRPWIAIASRLFPGFSLVERCNPVFPPGQRDASLIFSPARGPASDRQAAVLGIFNVTLGPFLTRRRQDTNSMNSVYAPAAARLDKVGGTLPGRFW